MRRSHRHRLPGVVPYFYLADLRRWRARQLARRRRVRALAAAAGAWCALLILLSLVG